MVCLASVLRKRNILSRSQAGTRTLSLSPHTRTEVRGGCCVSGAQEKQMPQLVPLKTCTNHVLSLRAYLLFHVTYTNTIINGGTSASRPLASSRRALAWGERKRRARPNVPLLLTSPTSFNTTTTIFFDAFDDLKHATSRGPGGRAAGAGVQSP
jgi:hypothetical protein